MRIAPLCPSCHVQQNAHPPRPARRARCLAGDMWLTGVSKSMCCTSRGKTSKFSTVTPQGRRVLKAFGGCATILHGYRPRGVPSEPLRDEPPRNESCCGGLVPVSADRAPDWPTCCGDAPAPAPLLPPEGSASRRAREGSVVRRARPTVGRLCTRLANILRYVEDAFQTITRRAPLQTIA